VQIRDRITAQCNECAGSIDISKGYNPTCGKLLGGEPPASRVWVGNKFHSMGATFACADLICPDCRRDDTVRRYSRETGQPLGFGKWQRMHEEPDHAD
jgi:hypothetical protein